MGGWEETRAEEEDGLRSFCLFLCFCLVVGLFLHVSDFHTHTHLSWGPWEKKKRKGEAADFRQKRKRKE